MLHLFVYIVIQLLYLAAALIVILQLLHSILCLRSCKLTDIFFLQTHAIMGTNGSGKSTLSKCLVGHPDYEVTSGSGTSKSLPICGVATSACHSMSIRDRS